MERLVQYLDDLEDLFYAAMLLMERALKALQICIMLIASFIIQFLGILLALGRPPLALAIVSLTVVGMLYRSVTSPHLPHHAAI